VSVLRGYVLVSVHHIGTSRYGTAVAYSRADAEQAEYFHRLFDGQRAELCERLEGQRLALARYEHIGDISGVRRKRRIIKAVESEARSIDCMCNALRRRLSQDFRLKS
jgi:hypothetical protein